MKYTLYILLLVIIFTACRKAAKKDSAFVGYWHGGPPGLYNSCSIDIDEDSRGSYTWYQYGSELGSMEGAFRISGHRMFIGKVRIKIIEWPTQIDTSQSNITVYDHFYNHWQKALYTMIIEVPDSKDEYRMFR